MLLVDSDVSETHEIILKRLQLDDLLGGCVLNPHVRDVGESGERTNRRELLGFIDDILRGTFVGETFQDAGLDMGFVNEIDFEPFSGCHAKGIAAATRRFK